MELFLPCFCRRDLAIQVNGEFFLFHKIVWVEIPSEWEIRAKGINRSVAEFVAR